ncbi:hypothetical protein, partial [Streptomyces sp. NPDC030920]|uniref:hypothetical protein n=1 Tax=Streptomyces sp. NPDC030920 TaxID=3365308 RepID=UPI00384ACF62
DAFGEPVAGDVEEVDGGDPFVGGVHAQGDPARSTTRRAWVELRGIEIFLTLTEELHVGPTSSGSPMTV